jgi:SAM-dependent methyltransferase
MESLEMRVVRSLDGDDVKLFEFLPYLLQDLAEMGTDSNLVGELLKRNGLPIYTKLNAQALDVGCGKGAVSLMLAKELGYSVTGIDAVPGFIKEANARLKQESSVLAKCTFIIGDVVEHIQRYTNMDLVILGAIGPIVFGGFSETLRKSLQVLKPGGYIILDDAYFPDHKRSKYYLPKSEFQKQIKQSGLQIVDELILDTDFVRQTNKRFFSAIKKRTTELIIQYPEKTKILNKYLEKQLAENNALEDELVCTIALLKKGDKN